MDRDYDHEQEHDLSRILQQWQPERPAESLDYRVLKAYRRRLSLRRFRRRIRFEDRYNRTVVASVLLCGSAALTVAMLLLSRDRSGSVLEPPPRVAALSDGAKDVQRGAQNPKLRLDTLLDLDAQPAVLTSLNTSDFEPLPNGVLRVILSGDKR